MKIIIFPSGKHLSNRHLCRGCWAYILNFRPEELIENIHRENKTLHSMIIIILHIHHWGLRDFSKT